MFSSVPWYNIMSDVTEMLDIINSNIYIFPFLHEIKLSKTNHVKFSNPNRTRTVYK